MSPLDTYTPPLGILHVASFTRKFRHEVRVFDFQVPGRSVQAALAEVISWKPDVVGLSAMTSNCMNALKIAREVKRACPSISTVLGGAHISAVPLPTMERFESIDYGVLGEGEVTFLELLLKIAERRSAADVEGIVWRNGDGQVVLNESRPPLETLDELPPPAWDLLEGFPDSYPSSILEAKRLPGTGIMTSRGCPFNCTFCDHRVFGSRVRFFSVEYALEMMRHLKRDYGIRDLMILDDNFLLDRERLFEICDRMIAEKMDFSWYCMGHARSMTDDKLAKIRDAGCWFIEMGIESGNDGILKRIRKGTTKDDVRGAVGRAKRAGLKVKGNFIFGFPGETMETLEETMRFALDIKIDFFQQNFLTVWPGCQIADELGAEPSDRSRSGFDWDRLAHQRVTFVPDGMTKSDLIHASKKAFRRFYVRPRIIVGLIPRLASWRGIKFGVTSFLVFLRTIFRKS